MEKLISLIIVVAGSLIYGWLKERFSSRGDSHKPTAAPPPPPEDQGWEPYTFHDGEYEYEAIPVPAPKPKVKKPVSKASPELISTLNLPVEGERVTETKMSPPSILRENVTEDAELAAHYARWRQSIIDAQILPPKF